MTTYTHQTAPTRFVEANANDSIASAYLSISTVAVCHPGRRQRCRGLRLAVELGAGAIVLSLATSYSRHPGARPRPSLRSLGAGARACNP